MITYDVIVGDKTTSHDYKTIWTFLERYKTPVQSNIIIDTLDRLGRYKDKEFLIKRVKS